MPMDLSLAAAINAIVQDTRGSAVEIAASAADVLLQRAQIGEAGDPDAFRHELLRTGWQLIAAHPFTAPLVNLVNLVLWKMEETDSPRGLREAVALATTEFQRQLRYHEGRIAEAALPLLADGNLVLTHAHSSTVRAALVNAHRAGRRFMVLCAETGPHFEGREMADELAEAGIAVQVLSDTQAVEAVPRVGLALVGAEHLTSAGLVNRAGTAALARKAHAMGVPIYGLCGSEKFLPPAYTLSSQPNQLHGNIWGAGNGPVKVGGVLFDRTPLGDLAGVVTEQGVLVLPAIEAWLAALKLHHDLRAPTTLQF
jgi:translation initiation factor eIF-2B subunit delta